MRQYSYKLEDDQLKGSKHTAQRKYMILLTEGGTVAAATEEQPAGTAVPTKSTAEEIGERLMETAGTMARDMGIPTPALIAIIVGKYILSSSCNTSYC
jgi:hypothetical protein